MSVQETKLKAIADAIREKEGTTAPIRANDFPSRILALETGGVPEGVYTITLSSSDESLGTVSGGGVASEGMTVVAKAAPVGGSKFKTWQESGEDVSSSAEYAFEVMRDRVLEALFEEFSLEWTPSTLPISTSLVKWPSVTYGNGKFVAVAGSRYDKAAYSTDGINWSTSTLPSSASWYSVTYGNGKFVAVASSNKAAYALA